MKIKRTVAAIMVMLLIPLSVSADPGFTSLYIGDQEFIVELADNNEKRALGLMFRKSIPDNFGMLFIYPDEDHRGIWMKNTYICLDLIFLNSSKEIVDIIPNVPPCKSDPCKTYISGGKAQYVLELKAGRAEDLCLKKGDRVYFIL